jgi:hypothetical protein
MRKLIVTGVIAALGIALLAIPASASFDHHFRVFEKARFHELPGGKAFRFKGKLFHPHHRHNRAGRDHGLCKIRPHETLRCRGTYHLNGEIGGFGDIKVSGNLGPDDNRLNVVGGSGDFNGVAGKLVFRYLNQRGTKSIDKFDLVR